MSIGERLKEERERLGLSQEKFGALGGVLKRAQINYEKDERHPDSAYLSAIAAAGADVLFVLTGERSAAMPATDAAEQVLLDSYRRCGDQARQHLIQTAALLAAGVGGRQETAPQPIQQKAKGGAVQVGGAVTDSQITTREITHGNGRAARKTTSKGT
ncbi:MAG: helix-turn-helix transcriptional regulator [Comamonas sp.]